MRKKRHKYILYLSLSFLIVTLYKGEYLRIPVIFSSFFLGVSFILLFCGFVINVFAQKAILFKYDYKISTLQTIAMIGLNIFSKYIPGKMWMVVGKSLYITERSSYNTASLNIVFLHTQIMVLWCGLNLGIVGLFLKDSLQILSWVGLCILGVFSLLIFSKKINEYIKKIVENIFHINIHFSPLSFTKTLSLLPLFFTAWIVWGIGFFFFSISLTEAYVPLPVVFCFPLSGAFGIMSLFSPGGIGVREGIMVIYLSLCNIKMVDAVTISIASRLWFMIGEFFIFSIGYLADKKIRKSSID